MQRTRSHMVAVIIWFFSIFFSILSGLFFYFFKRDDPFIHQQAREALNWGITQWLIALAISLLGSKILFSILGFVHLLICLLAMLSCWNGKAYTLPWSLRLVK